MSIKSEGEAEGVCFYGDPEALEGFELEMVDPLMRPLCKRINASGWCWTAESCQGHPDAPEGRYVWAGNTSPMLRLVCRLPDRGRMLDALAAALPGAHPSGASHVPCRLYVWKALATFAEVLVYLDAKTVAERDAALAAWARFAAIVSPGASGDGGSDA